MRNLMLLVVCCLSALSLYAQTPSVDALRTYAEEKGIPPKEYIFKLFEKSDIVVLGERDHRDTVQYDFIHDILADPRFAEQIGYVYTEVGSYNMNDDVNRLLQGSYPTDADFMDSLYAYCRKSETFYPIWEKYNRIKFLKGIYEINRTSPRKIELGLTDREFSWNEIRTVEDYKRFWESPDVNYRDSLMAAHISEMFARQIPLNGKRKALVITSQPHAINYSMHLKKGNKVFGTQGWWMKKIFGEEKVKIVVLNWFDYNLFNGSNFPMTGEGHWDAAFELMECRPFAIDLKNTPYGETAYNGLVGGTTINVKNKSWQDVADGLIYYAPLYDHVAAWGIEGLVTKEFEPEIKRRLTIFFQATQPGAEIPMEAAIDEYNVFHTYPAAIKSRNEVKQLIQQVLETTR
jgi:hypothetical protein|nr:MAG TPA: succinoglycan biosynthesis protein [Caudoviricetes sp.]DAG55296.1 MAG TPA: succinoglycan biosynthesis protein [Caudoviricetes sp.]